MSTTHLIAMLSLVLGVPACKKKDADNNKAEPASTDPAAKTAPDPAQPAPPPASKGRKIPNSNGLVVDAPAKWQDNGIGGAAGMHLDGLAGDFQLRESSAEEKAKTLDQYKEESQTPMFDKWVSAETTPDGWKALDIGHKIEMKGEEAVKGAAQFEFHIHRKIGDKPYECYGTANKKEDALEAMELCTKVTSG